MCCKVKPSTHKRAWMDDTVDKFAYRCLPMNIANQHSWTVECPGDITATWSGGDGSEDLSIDYIGEHIFKFALSEFGYGVLTFHTDFVLTTEEKVCIYCKGPANSHRKIIQPLEGIIETFWLPFTFTMNWKFTEPGTVEFKKGDPMFCFFPIELDYVEDFSINVKRIRDDEILHNKYQEYSASRKDHIDTGHTDDQSWQKHYMKGTCPYSNHKAPGHKTNLKLK